MLAFSHREVKKFEKKQSRIHNLREIAREKAASGHSRLAQAAATEADRLESPWLSSNTPVKPPSYACVSQGQATALKHVVYASIRAPTEPNLDLKKETKKLDVLNLKVGYAVDAQYALPDEVCICQAASLSVILWEKCETPTQYQCLTWCIVPLYKTSTRIVKTGVYVCFGATPFCHDCSIMW